MAEPEFYMKTGRKKQIDSIMLSGEDLITFDDMSHTNKRFKLTQKTFPDDDWPQIKTEIRRTRDKLLGLRTPSKIENTHWSPTHIYEFFIHHPKRWETRRHIPRIAPWDFHISDDISLVQLHTFFLSARLQDQRDEKTRSYILDARLTTRLRTRECGMIRQLGPTIDEIRTEGEGDSKSWLPQQGLDAHLQKINEETVEKLKQLNLDRAATGDAILNPSKRQMEATDRTKDSNRWLPHSSIFQSNVDGEQKSWPKKNKTNYNDEVKLYTVLVHIKIGDLELAERTAPNTTAREGQNTDWADASRLTPDSPRTIRLSARMDRNRQRHGNTGEKLPLPVLSTPGGTPITKAMAEIGYSQTAARHKNATAQGKEKVSKEYGEHRLPRLIEKEYRPIPNMVLELDRGGNDLYSINRAVQNNCNNHLLQYGFKIPELNQLTYTTTAINQETTTTLPTKRVLTTDRWYDEIKHGDTINVDMLYRSTTKKHEQHDDHMMFRLLTEDEPLDEGIQYGGFYSSPEGHQERRQTRSKFNKLISKIEHPRFGHFARQMDAKVRSHTPPDERQDEPTTRLSDTNIERTLLRIKNEAVKWIQQCWLGYLSRSKFWTFNPTGKLVNTFSAMVKRITWGGTSNVQKEDKEKKTENYDQQWIATKPIDEQILYNSNKTISPTSSRLRKEVRNELNNQALKNLLEESLQMMAQKSWRRHERLPLYTKWMLPNKQQKEAIHIIQHRQRQRIIHSTLSRMSKDASKYTKLYKISRREKVARISEMELKKEKNELEIRQQEQMQMQKIGDLENLLSRISTTPNDTDLCDKHSHMSKIIAMQAIWRGHNTRTIAGLPKWEGHHRRPRAKRSNVVWAPTMPPTNKTYDATLPVFEEFGGYVKQTGSDLQKDGPRKDKWEVKRRIIYQLARYSGHLPKEVYTLFKRLPQTHEEEFFKLKREPGQQLIMLFEDGKTESQLETWGRFTRWTLLGRRNLLRLALLPQQHREGFVTDSTDALGTMAEEWARWTGRWRLAKQAAKQSRAELSNFSARDARQAMDWITHDDTFRSDLSIAMTEADSMVSSVYSDSEQNGTQDSNRAEVMLHVLSSTIGEHKNRIKGRLQANKNTNSSSKKKSKTPEGPRRSTRIPDRKEWHHWFPNNFATMMLDDMSATDMSWVLDSDLEEDDSLTNGQAGFLFHNQICFFERLIHMTQNEVRRGNTQKERVQKTRIPPELKDENTTGKEFAPRCIVCYGARIHHKEKHKLMTCPGCSHYTSPSHMNRAKTSCTACIRTKQEEKDVNELISSNLAKQVADFQEGRPRDYVPKDTKFNITILAASPFCTAPNQTMATRKTETNDSTQDKSELIIAQKSIHFTQVQTETSTQGYVDPAKVRGRLDMLLNDTLGITSTTLPKGLSLLNLGARFPLKDKLQFGTKGMFTTRLNTNEWAETGAVFMLQANNNSILQKLEGVTTQHYNTLKTEQNYGFALLDQNVDKNISTIVTQYFEHTRTDTPSCSECEIELTNKLTDTANTMHKISHLTTASSRLAFCDANCMRKYKSSKEKQEKTTGPKSHPGSEPDNPDDPGGAHMGTERNNPTGRVQQENHVRPPPKSATGQGPRHNTTKTKQTPAGTEMPSGAPPTIDDSDQSSNVSDDSQSEADTAEGVGEIRDAPTDASQNPKTLIQAQDAAEFHKIVVAVGHTTNEPIFTYSTQTNTEIQYLTGTEPQDEELNQIGNTRQELSQIGPCPTVNSIRGSLTVPCGPPKLLQRTQGTHLFFEGESELEQPMEAARRVLLEQTGFSLPDNAHIQDRYIEENIVETKEVNGTSKSSIKILHVIVVTCKLHNLMDEERTNAATQHPDTRDTDSHTLKHMGTRSRTDITRLMRLGREIAIAESNVWDQKIKVKTTLSRPLQRLTRLININLGQITATPQEPIAALLQRELSTYYQNQTSNHGSSNQQPQQQNMVTEQNNDLENQVPREDGDTYGDSDAVPQDRDHMEEEDQPNAILNKQTPRPQLKTRPVTHEQDEDRNIDNTMKSRDRSLEDWQHVSSPLPDFTKQHQPQEGLSSTAFKITTDGYEGYTSVSPNQRENRPFQLMRADPRKTANQCLFPVIPSLAKPWYEQYEKTLTTKILPPRNKLEDTQWENLFTDSQPNLMGTILGTVPSLMTRPIFTDNSDGVLVAVYAQEMYSLLMETQPTVEHYTAAKENGLHLHRQALQGNLLPSFRTPAARLYIVPKCMIIERDEIQQDDGEWIEYCRNRRTTMQQPEVSRILSDASPTAPDWKTQKIQSPPIDAPHSPMNSSMGGATVEMNNSMEQSVKMLAETMRHQTDILQALSVKNSTKVREHTRTGIDESILAGLNTPTERSINNMNREEFEALNTSDTGHIDYAELCRPHLQHMASLAVYADKEKIKLDKEDWNPVDAKRHLRENIQARKSNMLVSTWLMKIVGPVLNQMNLYRHKKDMCAAILEACPQEDQEAYKVEKKARQEAGGLRNKSVFFEWMLKGADTSDMHYTTIQGIHEQYILNACVIPAYAHPSFEMLEVLYFMLINDDQAPRARSRDAERAYQRSGKHPLTYMKVLEGGRYTEDLQRYIARHENCFADEEAKGLQLFGVVERKWQLLYGAVDEIISWVNDSMIGTGPRDGAVERMTTEQVKEAMAEAAIATASQYSYSVSRAYDWNFTHKHRRTQENERVARRHPTQLLAIEGGGNDQPYQPTKQRFQKVNPDTQGGNTHSSTSIPPPNTLPTRPRPQQDTSWREQTYSKTRPNELQHNNSEPVPESEHSWNEEDTLDEAQYMTKQNTLEDSDHQSNFSDNPVSVNEVKLMWHGSGNEVLMVQQFENNIGEFARKQNQPPKKYRNDRGELICLGCGQPGHFRSNCKTHPWPDGPRSGDVRDGPRPNNSRENGRRSRSTTPPTKRQWGTGQDKQNQMGQDGHPNAEGKGGQEATEFKTKRQNKFLTTAQGAGQGRRWKTVIGGGIYDLRDRDKPGPGPWDSPECITAVETECDNLWCDDENCQREAKEMMELNEDMPQQLTYTFNHNKTCCPHVISKLTGLTQHYGGGWPAQLKGSAFIRFKHWDVMKVCKFGKGSIYNRGKERTKLHELQLAKGAIIAPPLTRQTEKPPPTEDPGTQRQS
jgi:hypothetical protein